MNFEYSGSSEGLRDETLANSAGDAREGDRVPVDVRHESESKTKTWPDLESYLRDVDVKVLLSKDDPEARSLNADLVQSYGMVLHDMWSAAARYPETAVIHIEYVDWDGQVKMAEIDPARIAAYRDYDLKDHFSKAADQFDRDLGALGFRSPQIFGSLHGGRSRMNKAEVREELGLWRKLQKLTEVVGVAYSKKRSRLSAGNEMPGAKQSERLSKFVGRKFGEDLHGGQPSA
jgi:hypothetical protein